MSVFRFLLSRTFLKQIVLAVLDGVVLIVLLMWWLRMSTNHGQQIEVPDLAHLDLVEVEQKLEEVELRYEILDSTNYNPEFEYQTVIDQIPAAGSFVKEDRKIYISLNRSGYPMIEVPDVVQKTLRQAVPTLTAMGFQLGEVIEKPDISDQVLEMRYKGGPLQPGTELQKTSVIDLVVGDGSLNRLKKKELDKDEEDQPEGDE